MEIKPGRVSRWFNPTYKVRFDNAEEAADMVTYGSVLPYPSIAKVRTMSLAVTAQSRFPRTITFSRDQLVDITMNLLADEFELLSAHPEDVANRLSIMSNKLLDAIGIKPPND